MIFIVISVLVILAFLGTTLYRSLRERAHFVSAHVMTSLLDFAAMEMAAVIYEDIGREMASGPASELFKDVVAAPVTGFQPIAVTGRDARWLAACTFPSRPEYAGFGSAVTLTFTDAEPLAATATWRDPREKLCALDLTLDLSLGRAQVTRRVRRVYRYRKLCKVVAFHLPVVSRFTLFLREPPATDEKAEGLNCFQNSIDGRALQTTKVQPLTLFNADRPGQFDLYKSGHIYLGGSREIQLHATSGGDSQYGELFQFYNAGTPSPNPPVFLVENPPATRAFSGQFPISTHPPLFGKLLLLGTWFGFYLLDNGNPAQDMNYNNTLERYLAGTACRTMKSSFLHLFGTLGYPTPALVVGKVRRVFAQYTALCFDTDGDNSSDGVLANLRSPAAQQTSGGAAPTFWETLKLPVRMGKNRKTGEALKFLELDMQGVFETRPTYLDHASRLLIEPVNRVYDYLSDDSRKYPPKELFKPKYGEYEQDGAAFRITRQTGDRPVLFDGDLGKVDSSALVTDRPTLVLDNGDQFRDRFLAGRDLDLKGGFVFVQKGPLEVPAGTTVVNPGLVAVRGDIRVLGDIKDGAPKPQVSLVSLGGDVVLDGTNQEVFAHLVALDGTVRPAKTNNRVKIRGALAVKTLDPLAWAAGGELTYESRFDPSLSEEGSYAVHFADFYDRWEVSPGN
ncbi:MAG: hypothetical protein GX442_13160 [Candidatus Riflebacteria bacterium]|nr:hypothetical protein [Candidatus Riflebacteria bacterium]